MIGDGAKRRRRAPFGSASSDTWGMFEIAWRPLGTVIVTSKTALSAGSSKQGKQRRALVASNCVVAITPFVPSGREYVLR